MTPDITVLVSTRIDAVSGRATRSRGDAVAVALALQHAAAERVRLLNAGTEAGTMTDTVARDYLALGARRIELLATEVADAGATTPAAAPANVLPLLAAALSDSPLVLTGTCAEGGLASGALPYALAAALGRPLLSSVVELQAQGPAWIVTQACAKGARRRLRLSVPAVLTVSPAAPCVPRHSYRDRMAGQIVRQRSAVAAPGPGAAPWQSLWQTPWQLPWRSPWEWVAAAGNLHVLQARAEHSERSGHARLLGAIDAQPAAGSGTVVAAGSASDKARTILDYLRAHALVNIQSGLRGD
jgi:electron transfer flavoprotein beta subunit